VCVCLLDLTLDLWPSAYMIIEQPLEPLQTNQFIRISIV
jgi:hypothetical protein